MLRTLALLALVLSAPQFVLANDEPLVSCPQALAPLPGKPWHERIDFARIEELLAHGEIQQIRTLEEFQAARGKKGAGTTANITVFTFEGDVHAVWKSDGGDAEREVGSYVIARKLGMELVPPTVMRDFPAGTAISAIQPGTPGSLQYYVDDNKYLLPPERKAPKHFEAPRLQREDRLLFNWVFGNWDGHFGNLVVEAYDGGASLAMIDNAAVGDRRVHSEWGGHPFVPGGTAKRSRSANAYEKADEFPFAHARLLENPTLEDFVREVGDRVSMEDILDRWQWIGKKKTRTMNIVFWQGELWYQGVSFGRFGRTVPDYVLPSTVEAYRAIKRDDLEKHFPTAVPGTIPLMLQRRDEFVRRADRAVSDGKVDELGRIVLREETETH